MKDLPTPGSPINMLTRFVIPREGVESSPLRALPNTLIKLVIPREGVESFQKLCQKFLHGDSYVIPREGVESQECLRLLLADHHVKGPVIPREGVESDARARSASFTFTSSPSDPERGS